MNELKAFVDRCNVKPPSFKMEGPYFVVTVYRAILPEKGAVLTDGKMNSPILKDLNENQIQFYRYVIENGPVSSGKYAEITGKTDRTVRNYYKGMEQVLKKEGTGPATKFALLA